MIWLRLALFGLAAFFVWAAIHELSHARAARKLGATGFRFKLYPHLSGGRLVFACVSYTLPAGVLDTVGVHLAPRVPDLVASLLFPLTGFQNYLEWSGWQTALAVLAAGGVVDLLVGSLGLSASSDLRRAAVRAEAPPNALRIPGLLMVGLSVSCWAALQFGWQR